LQVLRPVLYDVVQYSAWHDGRRRSRKGKAYREEISGGPNDRSPTLQMPPMPKFQGRHLLIGNTCTLLTPGRSYNAAVAETRKRTEARNIDCAIVFTINSFSWDIHVAGGWATPNRLRKIGIQVKERVTTHGNLWDFFEPVRIRGGCGSRSIQLGAEGSKQLHALSPSRLNAA
jgi:hypothetical protein